MWIFILSLFFFEIGNSETPAKPISGKEAYAQYLKESQEQYCFKTIAEWKTWREGFASIASKFDFEAAIKLARLCSVAEGQQAFFSEPKFKACMKPILEMDMDHLQDNFATTYFEKFPTPKISVPAEFLKLDNLRLIGNQNRTPPNALTEEEKTILKSIFENRPDHKGLTFLSNFIGYRTATIVPQSDPNQFVVLNPLASNADKAILPIVDGIWFDRESRKMMFFLLASRGSFELREKDPLDKIVLESDEVVGVATLQDQMVCGSCHPNGLNKVFPADNALSIGYNLGVPNDKASAKFNDSIKGTYETALAFAKDQTTVPSYGSASDEFRTRYLDDCLKSQNVNEVQKENISKSMSCVKCHEPQGTVHSLKMPFDHESTGPSIIYDHVVQQGFMPKSKDPHQLILDPKEREALKFCLQYEYFGQVMEGKKPGNWPGLLLKSIIDQKCEW
jgi:hypothetical protein